MRTTFTTLAALVRIALAQSGATSGTPTTLTSLVSASGSSVPTIVVSTAIASASAPAAPLPSQVPLPPKQAWCPSDIYCAGPVRRLPPRPDSSRTQTLTRRVCEQLLQTVNLAKLYADPKTVVDKPTNRTSAAVLGAFSALGGANATEGAVQAFVDANFRGEGLELEALALAEFVPEPAFLAGVSSPLVRAWARTVHGYWTQLIRGTNESATCPGGTDGGPCESSLIPLNHTFVVPGGRFREQCALSCLILRGVC